MPQEKPSKAWIILYQPPIRITLAFLFQSCPTTYIIRIYTSMADLAQIEGFDWDEGDGMPANPAKPGGHSPLLRGGEFHDKITCDDSLDKVSGNSATTVPTITNAAPIVFGIHFLEGMSFSIRMRAPTPAIHPRCIRPITKRISINPQQQPKQ